MTRDLLYFGITHDSAPLAIRENLRMDCKKRAAMLQRLARLADSRMVLSTCDRFEIYAHADGRGRERWLHALAGWYHVPASLLDRCVRARRGEDAGRHLLRVAAGLESRILGETHILGQVREAFLHAHAVGCLNADLSALGRAAIHSGKRVRHETAIQGGNRSLATLTADYLARRLHSFSDRMVVVVGTGVLAGDVLSRIAARRPGRLYVVGRNVERARDLAERFGAYGAPLEALPSILSRCAALVACTAAPTFVVNGDTIGPGRTNELQLVDLGVPRNVDPNVRCLPRAHLIHMDALLPTDENRSIGLARAYSIIEEEWTRFREWRNARHHAAEIRSLLEHAAFASDRRDPCFRRALHQRLLRFRRGAA